MNRSAVHSFRITERVQSPVNAVLFDLFHQGQVSLGGREIRLDRPALPIPVKRADHIEWQFAEPVRVSTPGPDSKVSIIRQYRNRIEFNVGIWASVIVYFNE